MVRFWLFLVPSSAGFVATVFSIAMVVFVLLYASDVALLPRTVLLAIALSMGVTGGAEVLAAWTTWKYDRGSAEDLRRHNDFVLGGYRAASHWRRVRNYGLITFLVLCSIFVLLFGR